MWGPSRDLTAERIWSLDLETTGLDPRTAHVLSVGLVPIRGHVIHWGERRYHRVRAPAGEALTEAVRVHELLPEELTGESADARVETLEVDDLVELLSELLEGHALLVHWGRLDVTIIRRLFRRRRFGRRRRWPVRRVIDTTSLLARLDRRRRLIEPGTRDLPSQLSAARAALGLPPHVEHHALYDALATAELYLALRARLAPKLVAGAKA